MVARATRLVTGYDLGTMTGVPGHEKAHGKGWEVQRGQRPPLYTPLVRHSSTVCIYSWNSMACLAIAY